MFGESLEHIRWLAESNYQLELPRDADASEVVTFPQTSNESHGIEDLRVVRFVDDDGAATYYGAMLLDLNDPLKIIGRLDEPLITPTEEERDGYVPNVAYSCGAMIHSGYLYLPFATSDRVTRIATVSLDAPLGRLIG